MISSLLEKAKQMLGDEGSKYKNDLHVIKPLEVANTKTATDDIQLKETVYDIIKTIKDPEKPSTLEDLNIVQEEDVHIVNLAPSNAKLVKIYFTPTIPHCSLPTMIGLSIRVKIERLLLRKVKLDVYVKKGTHDSEETINKQINDKERTAAALENPHISKIVESCILENE